MSTWGSKVKFVLVAGAGFFTDGYINLTIGLGTLSSQRVIASSS
jgi:hypothetical protein